MVTLRGGGVVGCAVLLRSARSSASITESRGDDSGGGELAVVGVSYGGLEAGGVAGRNSSATGAAVPPARGGVGAPNRSAGAPAEADGGGRGGDTSRMGVVPPRLPENGEWPTGGGERRGIVLDWRVT